MYVKTIVNNETQFERHEVKFEICITLIVYIDAHTTHATYLQAAQSLWALSPIVTFWPHSGYSAAHTAHNTTRNARTGITVVFGPSQMITVASFGPSPCFDPGKHFWPHQAKSV